MGLAVGGAGAALVGSAGDWTQASGKLVLTVAGGQTIPTGSDTVLTIALTNPAASQAVTAPTILADDVGQTGGTNIASATMSAAVLGTQGAWTTKTVAESESRVQGATNTITFTIQPDTALVASQTITIEGLTGSATADSSTLAVGGAGAALVNSAGVWTQNTGKLVLTVKSGSTIPTGSDTVLTIDLTNPATSQA